MVTRPASLIQTSGVWPFRVVWVRRRTNTTTEFENAPCRQPVVIVENRPFIDRCLYLAAF
jgi:hypothetical protein